jgi:hypothetical protein
MDDTTLRRLFSANVTLENQQGQSAVLPGPSFLFSVVMNAETDVADRLKRGCISRAELRMMYTDQPLAGMYKSTQLGDVPELSEKTRRGLALFGGLTPDGNIPAIKYDYKNCVGSVDFFYIPLILIAGRQLLDNPRHANGILVSKSKGTYFRIEPQYSQDEPRLDTPKIYEGIEKALNEIGAKSFTRTELNTTCPQYLTQDQNCLFWSAYVSREILRNIYKNQDPNTTIAQITALGKDKLDQEIKLFKETILEAMLRYLREKGITWKEYEATRAQTAGVYWPLKYYRGLTRKQNLQRKRSATRRTKMSFTNSKAYVPFKSDKGVKTRKSSYTERFHKKYPGVKSLPEIAKATGISKGILQEVYDRGMAAWRTGHRPGASQQAWGMARVHSFVMKGKTWRTADADLASKVKSST